MAQGEGPEFKPQYHTETYTTKKQKNPVSAAIGFNYEVECWGFNQGLSFPRQVLYHLSHAPNPK
jgi:hypothetical protein